MDTDSVIIHIITEYCFVDISYDVERWFDTSNYDGNDKRPFSIGKNKKVIGLFNNELGAKIMKEFCAIRAKTYSYLMDDNSEVKKSKGTKKCVRKRKTMFENYTDCVFNDKIILKSQQRFKSDHHKVHTEEFNKIALSSADDKRLEAFNKIETYRYGTPAVKVCESEMMVVRDMFIKNIRCFTKILIITILIKKIKYL